MSHVAVIDIGKTNAKLAVVDTGGMREIGVLTRPNKVIDSGPFPHFDVDGIWRFVLEGLKALHAAHGIGAISVTTHGASGALLDGEGSLACPILDYEHDGPDALAPEYDALRPDFSETGSPRLPKGLNLGAQLHWLLETQRGLDGRMRRFVTYPQFWSGRLSGTYRCDYSSLGCHTDLWAPNVGRLSGLADTLSLRSRIQPVARAATRLGPALPEVTRITGLGADTPVYCGIHDSNASLLPHLIGRSPPFAVVSTGTWVVAMAVGGAPPELAPERDTLTNVDAYGRPVPSARFMGGREFERLRGETSEPGAADVEAVLSGKRLLLPAIERGSGPFPGRVGGWRDPDIAPGEKFVALSYYLALMTTECLGLIGAAGPTIVEGPFARNTIYLDMLAAATGREVVPSVTTTGTSVGAAILATDDVAMPRRPKPHRGSDQPRLLVPYAEEWRAAVEDAGLGRLATTSSSCRSEP